MKTIAPLLFFCVLAAGCSRQAQKPAPVVKIDAVEASVEKGPVKLQVRFTPKELRLADMAEMEVVVRAEPDVDITPPPFGQAVGDFLVRDYQSKTLPADGSKIVRQFKYKLEPVRSGKHIIRSVSVEFVDRRQSREAKAEPVLLESEPLEINVVSELGEATPDLAQLAPMNDPRLLPASPLKWIVFGALAAALAGLGGALWLRSRRKETLVAAKLKTPEEIAREELAALMAENLHGRGEFKEFYVRLTGIVRRYIERTTGIHAPEQTTEEFLRDMRQRQVFPYERAQRLADFLEAADMVKYAGVLPGLRQIEEAVARAQEFVGLPSALQSMPAPVGITATSGTAKQ